MGVVRIPDEEFLSFGEKYKYMLEETVRHERRLARRRRAKKRKIKRMKQKGTYIDKGKGVVQNYSNKLGDALNRMFDNYKNISSNAEKIIEQERLPKLIKWYLKSLEEAGMDLSKFLGEFEFPPTLVNNLKKVKVEPMKLSKLYYKYWFPMRGVNYSKSVIKSFSPLSWIASGIYHYINSDFDYLMMVNGLEGTGKSALAINMAMRLKFLGLGFNPVTHIFFKSTPEDYIINMIENTHNQVFIFDEARAHFWKRSSLTKEQKGRILSLTMQRARNHVYLLCTRQPDDIDLDLRDSRVASVLYLIDKGEAAFLINRNVGVSTNDPFGFRKLEKKFKFGMISSPMDLRMEIINLPSFHGYMKVANIPEKLYNLYKELKLNLNTMGKLNLVNMSKDTILSKIISDDKIMKLVAKKVNLDESLLKNSLIGAI